MVEEDVIKNVDNPEIGKPVAVEYRLSDLVEPILIRNLPRRKITVAVHSDVLLKWLEKGDKAFEKILEKAEKGEIDIIVVDFCLYEALGSLKRQTKLVKKLQRLVFTTKITYSPLKTKLSKRRIKYLRSVAFGE